MKRRTCAVEQMPAGAAQAFLEHGAGHTRVGTREQARRMELYHLHVAQRQTCAQRHGKAVHALVAGWRVVAIHGRAAAGCQQHGLRGHNSERSPERMSIIRTPAKACRSAVGMSAHRAVLFEALDRPRPDLLQQPVDDLDPGKIALVHGAIEGLAGKRLCHAACRRGCDRRSSRPRFPAPARARRPCVTSVQAMFWLRQPLAALDGVHEVTLDRVARD